MSYELRVFVKVVDRGSFSAAGADLGLTPDTPLSFLWSWSRAMRFFDGPDEVHLRSIARAELAPQRLEVPPPARPRLQPLPPLWRLHPCRGHWRCVGVSKLLDVCLAVVARAWCVAR